MGLETACSLAVQLQLIGPHPLALDAQGGPSCRIGTLFPQQAALYTKAPGVHAWQRLNFIDHLNAQRAATGQAALTPDEEEAVTLNSVDLVFDSEQILI